MEWVILIIFGAVIVYIVLQNTVFLPPKCERIYFFIEEEWKAAIEYEDLIAVHAQLVYLYDLSDEEAKLCIENYCKGLPWFKEQSFLN